MELKRVVVTGLGAITPIGNDVETTWLNAVAGKSGAAPITHFDASKFKTQFACEVKGYNANDHFDRKKLRQLDLYAQYGIVAARQAVADSGIEEASNLNRDRVGVIVAAGIGGLHTFEEEAGYYAVNGAEQGPKYNPFFIPKMIADIASGHISMEYGYHGPNFGVVSACASSNNAIIDAFNLIRLGKADAIVTGGAEAAIFPAGVGGFNSMHALSTRNDSPETASRPFSASRDGFVMGEGSVVLILEELEHAKARGAKIYAEIAGGGMSADAHHLTATHPEGLGAKLAMSNALEDAGMKPEDIDYINVHGTSTPVGDISEVKAIVELFGDQAHKLNISSTKSMTGHLLGATGALEAMFSVLAVKNDIVPPTINHEEGDNDENIDYTLNFTFNKAENRPVRAALSNSFGFGGHNATVIVKKYEE
ncbi:beta-ketoacyl-ACP synthase II [uncultured Duncaniella sp.]|uniref:beta-ketoacyl-ACP synthase II n=1 Tax=uncultured Duncaniella sp. TaxID=2768039 RepID=UPI0025A941A1|nr:beta-ketoacyl-ACP synthase II [uncultured Duncaniella sp.]